MMVVLTDGGAGVERRRAGFTLVEMLLVVGLLALVTSMATLLLSEVRVHARVRVAESDMRVIRDALLGGSMESGYLGDMQGLPGFSLAHLRIHNLLSPTNVVGRDGVWLDQDVSRQGYAHFYCFTNWSAETGRGWRGPYVKVSALTQNFDERMRGLFPGRSDVRFEGDLTFAERGFYPEGQELKEYPGEYKIAYGLAGEMAVSDPWGNPYVLQVPPEAAFRRVGGIVVNEQQRFRYARLVSAGPDGRLQTPCFAPDYSAVLNRDQRSFLKLAGRLKDGSVHNRGDDIVLYVMRADVYEEEE